MDNESDANKDDLAIDHILEDWPFDPFAVNVRLLEVSSRQVLQMRVDMGILQLETVGRPDGVRPHGATTYYEFLKRKANQADADFVLNEDECVEVDREFVQFYHRRVCWLQLKKFDRAVKDADHTLGLMDFCKRFSPDEDWTISHEQYRPFVLYHRTQAAALAILNGAEDDAPQLAVQEVNEGLENLKRLFVDYEAEEQYEEDELVLRLKEFRESLRTRYELGDTLQEQLDLAIANEDYELAADLRDRIAAREESSQAGFDESEFDFIEEPRSPDFDRRDEEE